jgi:DNA repair exonuclease SbcCD ATPase subunit
LNKDRTTIVSGKNGAAKSAAILDSICFGLFGCAYRDCNKNDVVNWTNKSDCLVEIYFSTSNAEYKVVRGLRPNIFEISENGTKIDPPAGNTDYQKYLEQYILKINKKTFTQVVILGSANYTPFMKLAAKDRRDVIEDILDITIFSTMNELLKKKVQETKEKISKIDTAITLLKEKSESQKKLITTIVDHKNSNIQSLLDKIDANNEELEKVQALLDEHVATSVELNGKVEDHSRLNGDLKNLELQHNQGTITVKTIQKNIQFFDKNDTCPSCSQDITPDYKKKFVDKLKFQLVKDEEKIGRLEVELNELNAKLELIQNTNIELNNLNREIVACNNRSSILRSSNSKLQQEIDSFKSDNTNIDEEKNKLKQIAQDALAKLDDKNGLIEQRALQDVSQILLKDSGIKTSIVREYLPAINKFINNYLVAMDFFTKFELDESFKGIFKPRGIDEYTYENFSEGQKVKIDLAILFTWRKISEMKNSVHCNLLIMDEILDRSLDTEGIECFINLLAQLNDGMNIFILTPKPDLMADKFNKMLQFEMRNDFSYLIEEKG